MTQDTLTTLRAAADTLLLFLPEDAEVLVELNALIAAMEKKGPCAYLVFDENGLPEHATVHPKMAQDHINDAIQEFDFMQAAKWTVRPVYLHPAQPVEQPAIDGWTLVPIGDLKELYHSIHGNRFMGEDWEKKAISSMMPKERKEY